MKQYPSIDATVRRGVLVYAFDKLDGSNIRAEWNKKKGFSKFGSRHQLIDESEKTLGPSIPLIKQKYEKDLTEIFKKQNFDKVTCFFEFFGPGSFAGFHPSEEPKDVVLFDIDVYKTGLISPKEFISLTDQKVQTAKLLYTGNVTNEFEKEVRSGTLEGMSFEGVICKTIPSKKFHGPTMFKIKNQAWYDKLHVKCENNPEVYEKLK